MATTSTDRRIVLDEPTLPADDALALLAHDIRSSVTVIRGFAKTLRDREAQLSATDRRVGLDAILRHTELITRFASEMIEVGREDTGRLGLHREHLDLSDLVAWTVGRTRNDHPDHRFIVRNFAPGALVHADIVRIEQVLMNLLGNAAKCAPAGTEIEVVLKRSRRSVTVTVHDHGPGFPESAPLLLFKKFTRLPGAPPGTGLGLYMCRLIVEAHEGHIWVRTGPGGTVSFRLPAVPYPSDGP